LCTREERCCDTVFDRQWRCALCSGPDGPSDSEDRNRSVRASWNDNRGPRGQGFSTGSRISESPPAPPRQDPADVGAGYFLRRGIQLCRTLPNRCGSPSLQSQRVVPDRRLWTTRRCGVYLRSPVLWAFQIAKVMARRYVPGTLVKVGVPGALGAPEPSIWSGSDYRTRLFDPYRSGCYAPQRFDGDVAGRTRYLRRLDCTEINGGSGR
jgi:hypothetical protein